MKYHSKVNDEVMLERNNLQRKVNPLHDGPFAITKQIYIYIYMNGTVRIQKVIVSERINIRRVSSYRTSDVHP